MSKPKDGASYYRALNKAQAAEAMRRKAAEEQKKIRTLLGLEGNKYERNQGRTSRSQDA